MHIPRILKAQWSRQWDFIGSHYIFYYCLEFLIGYLIIKSLNRNQPILNGFVIMGCYLVGLLAVRLVSEDFKFMIQNGYTRLKYYESILLVLLISSIFMVCMDLVLETVFMQFTYYNSIFEQIYRGDVNFFLRGVWEVSLYFMIGMFMSVVSLCYQAIGKARFWKRTIVIVVCLIVGIPMLFMVISSSPNAIDYFVCFLILMGITVSGVNLMNPILFFGAISFIYALIAYIQVRKIELK